MSDTSYYKNLKVWKKSIDFIEQIYKITSDFPKTEIYWLTDQIRRAAISISSNIAEGSGRSTEMDYMRFLHIANWSALEVETQIIIAERLGYIEKDLSWILQDTIGEIIKIIG